LKLFALPTIFCDAETHWADDYTLSKMPTQAYICDSRFRAHGFCIAINDGPIKWFSHDVLEPVFRVLHAKYPRAIWVAHNALFDLTILSLVYGVHPFLIADTAGMSRALVGSRLRSHTLDKVSELLLKRRKGLALAKSKNIEVLPPELEIEIASYCRDDVDLMREAYKILCSHFPSKELLVMTWLTKMMTEPKLMLDETMLWNYHNEVVERKTRILEDLQVDKKDLMSNDKFAVLLDTFGVVAPTKLNAKGEEKYAFAKTDQGLKDLLEHENEDVQALVAARMEVKSTIEETRSRTFAELSTFNPVGIPLAYSGAVNTHRFSGRDRLNFQNMKRGGTIRNSIYAPEGYELIVSDFAQIELRLTLWLAGHRDAVHKLHAGGDLYSEFASELYGVEVTKNKAKEDRQYEEMRHTGKEVILGSGFGMGPPKLQTYLGGKGSKVTPDFAKRAIKLYRTTYHGVSKLWKVLELCYFHLINTGEAFESDDFGGYVVSFGFDPLFGSPGIKLPSGLWLKYPDLKIQDEQWTFGEDNTKCFGGYFLENLIQALARCILTDKTLKLNERYPVVMSTHDEPVVMVPEGQADELIEWVQGIMTEPVSWLPHFPVGAETKSAVRYGDAK